MAQKSKWSALESVTNTVTGVIIAFGVNLTVLPALGHDVTFGDSATLTAVFAVVATLRSYTLRRIFARYTD